MSKKTKIDHIYDVYPLYELMAGRAPHLYMKEAYKVAQVINYYRSRFNFEPKSSLELFSGGKSAYAHHINRFTGLQLQPKLLELRDHGNPDIIVGNIVTKALSSKYDLIYNPWTNLPCIVEHPSQPPSREALMSCLINVRKALNKGGVFVTEMDPHEASVYFDSSVGGNYPTFSTLAIPALHSIRDYYKLSPFLHLNLVTESLVSYDNITNVASVTYLSCYISNEVGKKLVDFDVRYPNRLRHWENSELFDAMRDAGFKHFYSMTQADEYEDSGLLEPLINAGKQMVHYCAATV